MDHSNVLRIIDKLDSRLSLLESNVSLNGLALVESSKKPEVKLAKLIVQKAVAWMDGVQDEYNGKGYQFYRQQYRDKRFIQISGLIQHFTDVQHESDPGFVLDFGKLNSYVGIEFRDRSSEIDRRSRVYFTTNYRQLVEEIINKVQRGLVRSRPMEAETEGGYGDDPDMNPRHRTTEQTRALKELTEIIVSKVVSWVQSYHDPARKDFTELGDKIDSYHQKGLVDANELIDSVYAGLSKQPRYFVTQKVWNGLEGTIRYCYQK